MLTDSLFDEIKPDLLAGNYNLLLGSGITLDSQDGMGEKLQSAEDLRSALCALTGIRSTSSLPRAAKQLTPEQVRQHLVLPFSKCSPGPSLAPLAGFLWQRIFTFNIDDVLETLYGRKTAKQSLVPTNFDDAFEPTPRKSELQAVHLHGWVGKPDSGFVFSHADYAAIMSGLNPWMHLLSEILATEAFIIAGTSLDEVDLEYYLSFRTAITPRRTPGPSLLVEPYPDRATRADCDRHGLRLVEADFGTFLKELRRRCPAIPSVAELVVPDEQELFAGNLEQKELLAFFSDFELLKAGAEPLPPTPPAFLYGRKPEWQEIRQHVDIERGSNVEIAKLIESALDSDAAGRTRIVLLSDEAGSGKSTALKRVAHSLLASGTPVISVRTLQGIDVRNAKRCLRALKRDAVILVDDLADHAEQVREILADDASRHVIVLGAERSYRRTFLDALFAQVPETVVDLEPLTVAEMREIIERYRRYGLVAKKEAVSDPESFAQLLLGEPVAVAICRILNDFRPLDAIVNSLWEAASPEDRTLYLCAALASFCYATGIRYSLLQQIAGPRMSMGDQLDSVKPLALATNPDQSDFVVPMHPTIGAHVIRLVARDKGGALLQTFISVARLLAPHVSRRAIIVRSPEARLTSRLFNADQIVTPLLGERAEDFYIAVKDRWQWNSRYWEQRALLVAESDHPAAVQYARHAVAIEPEHSFPRTTLAKILLLRMGGNDSERNEAFEEALRHLKDAIDREAKQARVSIHPFSTVLSGTLRFAELGGELSPSQAKRVRRFVKEATYRFPRDSTIRSMCSNLESLIGES